MRTQRAILVLVVAVWLGFACGGGDDAAGTGAVEPGDVSDRATPDSCISQLVGTLNSLDVTEPLPLLIDRIGLVLVAPTPCRSTVDALRTLTDQEIRTELAGLEPGVLQALFVEVHSDGDCGGLADGRERSILTCPEDGEEHFVDHPSRNTDRSPFRIDGLAACIDGLVA
ncbi:MAG: hypothetical protein M3527_06315, partial [Actinomycetota bacterium]|nr:hypothetical protein [Actinomycetota bacterium]